LDSIKSIKSIEADVKESNTKNIKLQNQLNEKIKKPMKPPDHSSDEISEEALSQINSKIGTPKNISVNEDILENKNEVKSVKMNSKTTDHVSKKMRTKIFEDDESDFDSSKPTLSKFVKSTVMNKSRRRQLK
jgi:hypothetical protein